jgi:hypothetical protein
VRNADVRASRVALIADAIVNGDVPGADAAVSRLIDLGYGFLMMPAHGEPLPSTPTTLEYLLDDAVDYRRHDYEVIVVGAAALPQHGVWIDWLRGDLARRGEPALREVDLSEIDQLS